MNLRTRVVKGLKNYKRCEHTLWSPSADYTRVMLVVGWHLGRGDIDVKHSTTSSELLGMKRLWLNTSITL